MCHLGWPPLGACLILAVLGTPLVTNGHVQADNIEGLGVDIASAAEADIPIADWPASDGGSRRTKRGWVWNQFFVLEEYTAKDPLHVGKLHSDSDPGDGKMKYVLTGDGAGSIFVIDDRTGDIHATRRLDREEKAYYTLTAQVVDRETGNPLEPPSEFVVKVQDINDNAPQFLDGPYHGTVPEMANVGTPVIQVTATDKDDPTYGNSARVVYSLLEGHPYFSVDPHTGEIRTALADMDREAREEYKVIIQGKDMGGHMGGLTGTTTITITLTDVNDNPPKFPKSNYGISVPEMAPLGFMVGQIHAEDADVAENAAMTYTILNAEVSGTFLVETDPKTQKGIITLGKPLDFERKAYYQLLVQAANTHVDSRFTARGPFRDSATVRITVQDEDEPPIFLADVYLMEVSENSSAGSYVGSVSAQDPDRAKQTIHYSINRNLDPERFFDINPQSGALRTARVLDREVHPWHNLSVFAKEDGGFGLSSEATVAVRIRDVNDNAPQVNTEEEVLACERTTHGKVLRELTAVDLDEGVPSFRFSLLRDNPNFTIIHNPNKTAQLLLRPGSVLQAEQSPMLLPLAVSDGGSPSLTGTSTLTVRVCSCSPDGYVASCAKGALIRGPGLSAEALIAILACLLILLIIVVLFVTLRRKRKEPLLAESEGDVRETVVSYDDEGGGEEDTEAFDIAALKHVEGGIAGLPDQGARRDIKPEHAIPPGVLRRCWPEAQGGGEMGSFLQDMLLEADRDPSAPPYDSLQVFAYEGAGSVAGSLSSLDSRASTDSDQNYDYLNDWGPRFQKLSAMYADGGSNSGD
uniref:cadherin-7-like n=1 Tax=Myxine glutinosa TaxID=7769 RepID=UPI00358DF62D